MTIRTESIFLLVFLTFTIIETANAALVERLDGLAYYDTDADLTWLADANYAKTIGDDPNGYMSWNDAISWASSININGVEGWRLPDTLQPDPACTSNINGVSRHYNCQGSEMGNMFYNVLGGELGSSLTTTHNSNYDLFSNITTGVYWSQTEFSGGSDSVWHFTFSAGYQDYVSTNNGARFYSWAVHDGDVAIVPLPATFWLFVSGLVGVCITMKRKK